MYAYNNGKYLLGKTRRSIIFCPSVHVIRLVFTLVFNIFSFITFTSNLQFLIVF